MPAKASSWAVQGLRPPSLASQLLQGSADYRWIVVNATPCRSPACRRRRRHGRCKAQGRLRWQACSYRDQRCIDGLWSTPHPVGARHCRRRRRHGRCKARGRLRWQASSYRDQRCIDELWSTPHPVGARLAGEGVVMGGARLKAAFAGKPAPTGISGLSMDCGQRHTL